MLSPGVLLSLKRTPGTLITYGLMAVLATDHTVRRQGNWSADISFLFFRPDREGVLLIWIESRLGASITQQTIT